LAIFDLIRANFDRTWTIWVNSIGGKRFGMGAKPQGVWGTGVPQRGPGAGEVGGLGDEVPQKLKNF